jgi:hypothetical protein
VPPTITIPRRFCGPPDSGNGGYTAGSLAQHVGGSVEVTLRRPPPLDVPLAVERRGAQVVLLEGDTVIAEAVAVPVDTESPQPVAPDVAAAASAASILVEQPEVHPFPTCFACGPKRSAGDGLRLFAGRVAGTELFAVPWTPPADLTEPIVWSALDCPSSTPMYLDDRPPPHVLGRITARIDALPVAGEQHVIMAWRIGRDDRKLFSGSAIFDPDKKLCAIARATWIQLR